jgi:hypothetical protein
VNLVIGFYRVRRDGWRASQTCDSSRWLVRGETSQALRRVPIPSTLWRDELEGRLVRESSH